jgi:F-type H+-transporting ATPase subunit b
MAPPMLSSVFIVPGATFIAELVAFLVVLWFVWKYVLPPLNRMLSERQEAIRSELAAADQAKADAEAADADRRAALDHARAEARRIVEQAQHTAERLTEEARSRGQGEYERLVSGAEAELRLARQRALEEAAQRLGELVVEVVERIIGREMDAAAHRDLIDEAVDALAREAGSDPGGAAAAAAADVEP